MLNNSNKKRVLCDNDNENMCDMYLSLDVSTTLNFPIFHSSSMYAPIKIMLMKIAH